MLEGDPETTATASEKGPHPATAKTGAKSLQRDEQAAAVSNTNAGSLFIFPGPRPQRPEGTPPLPIRTVLAECSVQRTQIAHSSPSGSSGEQALSPEARAAPSLQTQSCGFRDGTLTPSSPSPLGYQWHWLLSQSASVSQSESEDHRQLRGKSPPAAARELALARAAAAREVVHG